MKTDRIIKISVAICAVLVAIAILAAWDSPATGYEPSIYTATPAVFWVLLAIAIIWGISIIVHQVFTGRSEGSSLWGLGLLLILLSGTVILSLYIIRDYTMWGRGDFSSHIGIITNIISSGHIERQNYYPIAHIYIAEFSLVFGTVPVLIGKLLFPIFFSVYVLFMYILARAVLLHKGQAILVSIATATFVPFLSGWLINPNPNHLANLVFPLALFVLIMARTATKSQAAFRILFLILVLLIPMFHPVVNFILVFVLLTIGLPQPLFAFSNSQLIKSNDNSFRDYIPSLMLLIIWGFAWLSSFGLWEVVIRNIYEVATEGGETQLQQLLGSIEYAQGYGYSAVAQFFRIYGAKALFILLTILSIYMLRRDNSPSLYLRRLGSMFNALAALVFISIFFYAIDAIFSPTRILPYIMVLCTVFTGFVLYKMLKNEWFFHHRNYLVKLCPPVVVIIILVSAFTHGILNCYSSTFQQLPANQLTRSETAGMSWFFNNRNTDMDISCILISPSRFADILLTREEKQAQGYLSLPTLPPHHFGYDKSAVLGASYTKDSYMLLAKIDRDLYTEVWPDMAELRYLPGDFERLENDGSVDKLYSNGGIDIWYVQQLSAP